MVTKRRIWTIALAVVILGFLAWFALRPPSGPVYQGKTAEQWLYLLARDRYSAGTNGQALLALQQMGETVAPALIKGYLTRETALERTKARLWNRFPTFLKKGIPRPLTATQINRTAVHVMNSGTREFKIAMGRRIAPLLLSEVRNPATPGRERLLTLFIEDFHPEADLVVPAFSDFLVGSNKSMREIAAWNLSSAYSRSAIPALSNLIVTMGDPDPGIRRFSVFAVAQIGPAARPAIPALERCLQDKETRFEAARALWWIDRRTNVALEVFPGEVKRIPDASAFLGEIGPAASTAIPDLVDATESQDNNIRFYACQALWKIDGGRSPVVTNTLVKILDDPRTGTYHLANAISLLGEIGPGARAANPALAKLTNHPDVEVRGQALATVQKINGSTSTNPNSESTQTSTNGVK